jgi:glycosidase
MPAFRDQILARSRPARLDEFQLPRRTRYFPSPADWRNEFLYFLLPDRFSDGAVRPMLDRSNPAPARRTLSGRPWYWSEWARSGGGRFQGGTLRGIRSRLDYLEGLGVTALWIAPIFKQRGHLDTYHGYGIQDFLDIDPRFGTRQDLTDLVAAAHGRGIRVILDVVFNHSGANWLYPEGTPGGPWKAAYTTARHPFGAWLDESGRPAPAVAAPGDAVWPAELQDPDAYTRAGTGSLGAGRIDDPAAEHKRTDFEDLRDFRLDAPGVLTALARCYKYWIALTDCDGFRIDTLKHVSLEQARNFCGSIKEFAANLGKSDFFLLGEIAGGDYNQRRYLDVAAQNLNAALDIGEMRVTLTLVAKGLAPPAQFFDGFQPGRAEMGSHRNLGRHHVSVLDDHDQVFTVGGRKLRFSAEAASNHQAAAGVALQLLTLGIPCLYYGTEQALAGAPEPAERHWLPEWGLHDRYLREALFGPEAPLAAGAAGLSATDPGLPGFGPFGTSGRHLFDPTFHLYRRIAALARLRRRLPALSAGRQYQRPVRIFNRPFAFLPGGEIAAWSRILDDEEILCVLNTHGLEPRGADVLVDVSLNPPAGAMTVLLNTAQQALPTAGAYTGPHPAGQALPVLTAPDGTRFVEIRGLPPSETLVLSNIPESL